MSGRSTDFLPPTTYQGGKGRLAGQIVETIGLPIKGRFYDLCCGSGAVAVAAVERGQPPSQITMVDRSPWGLFWAAIGRGTFDVERFARITHNIPIDPTKIKAHIQRLFSAPVGPDAIYHFLLLQAATFGGSPVWIDGDSWRAGGGFMDYWVSKPTSSRQNNSRNPMAPMPQVILSRVKVLAERMRGVAGMCYDLRLANSDSIRCKRGDVAYIDPPYVGSTAFGYELSAVAVASNLHIPCWVSEAKGLGKRSVRLSGERTKGGMNGARKTANEEWLTILGPAQEGYEVPALGSR